MPLDHYVSQVHLRGFADPADGRLHAFRKPGGEHLRCRTQDVCRDPDWSTNEYLNDPRIVETLLREIEPRYGAAVENLAQATLRPEDILAIAGFAAFVSIYTPTGMRLSREVTRGPLETVVRVLDVQGELPPPPPVLGRRSLSELIETGAVQFSIDGQYALALGVRQLHRLIDRLGNGCWTVYHVDPGVGAFFTSDYPAACVLGSEPQSLRRFVPLRPDLGVLVQARRQRRASEEAVSEGLSDFDELRITHRQATVADLRRWNRVVVQSAENFVFAGRAAPWVSPFVKRYGDVWLETVVRPVESETRPWPHCRLALRPRPSTGHVRPERWR